MTILIQNPTMRYWKLRESNRVIAVPVLMTPRWEEITLDKFKELRGEISPTLSSDGVVSG
jgi:hypothetical protein